MDSNTIDICVIEDDAVERALLLQRLMNCDYKVVQAGDGKAGLQQIYQHRPRVVICDLMLPKMNGIEVCRQVRTDPSLDGTYLIVVTAYDSREHKHQALNAGADDYLCKPFDPDELRARIRNGMRVNRLQERLQRAARTDALTGLWNYTQFRDMLDREFARTRRYGGVVSLLMIDLDHFKAVNDTYGHEAGNRILQAIGRHLLNVVRDADIVARYGGEEFAVICPQTKLDEAAGLAERIRHSLPREVRIRGHEQLIVRGSVGVACTADARVNSVSDLINLGDQSLYTAKRQGRNRISRCDQLSDDHLDAGLQMDDVDRLRKQVFALNMQAKQLCLQSVWALVQALEARDQYSAWHSQNVTFYARSMAHVARWDQNLRTATEHAAMLHDLGKIGVPDRILQKPDSLTPDEARVLRQVPLMTCKILEPLQVFGTEILIIRHLRERFDGGGYPDGLVGSKIPIGSRLLAVAEAFDAITSDRAYRAPREMPEALEAIKAETDTQFDPEFVELLERTSRKYGRTWQAQIDRARARLGQPVAASEAADGVSHG